MAETMTATQAHALVERDAQRAKPEVRDVRATLRAGKAVRQGDVYLVRLDDSQIGVAKRATPMKTMQIVDGTSSGSRHVVTGRASLYEADPAVKLATCIRPDALLGPLVVATEECVVTHPEHAHVRIPAGVYQTVHQLDAATRQRVQD